MAVPALRAGEPLVILIVDDSPEDRAVYRRLLAQDREQEYRFLETGLGEEGLRIGREQRPDCLLLDYRLPDLDGLEFLSRLGEGLGERMDADPLPVIVLTGQGSESVAVQAMKSGAQDYLLKDSISAESLHRAVANAVEKVALRQEIREHTAELSRRNAELKREIAERERAEAELQKTYAELEVLVHQRTAELSRANAELKREIGEREKAEQERAQLLVREQAARRQAEDANRIKDEFLATLSHELRTPLNAILGWAQMLRMTKLDEATASRAYETIERNAKAQAQLISDLLDVSRIITGKLRLEQKSVELPLVLDVVLDTVRPAAEAKGIGITFHLDRWVGPVLGDPDRLQQVIWNLFSNAIKFTPVGGRVDVDLRAGEGCVEIRVSDTGSGIHPQFLPYVFDRFRQAESTSTRSHGGLGLGLSIVRHLVELHGGTVAVESAGEGKGATFTVSLPARAIFLPVTSPAAALPSTVAVAPWGSRPLAGVRVLVVEDEDDTRELLVRALESNGAAVTAVASVAQALEQLDRRLPDVLLSDIGMPEEDGYTLIHKLRARGADQGATLPAAALTAYARTEDRERALAAGFQTHIAKPIDPSELIAAVARLAGRVG
ncbi:MAG TPA: response regulator [Thermoanaerobaculia bacterium]|nr:response regulator [Thermoanaerobaculia bacterium]